MRRPQQPRLIVRPTAEPSRLVSSSSATVPWLVRNNSDTQTGRESDCLARQPRVQAVNRLAPMHTAHRSFSILRPLAGARCSKEDDLVNTPWPKAYYAGQQFWSCSRSPKCGFKKPSDGVVA